MPILSNLKLILGGLALLVVVSMGIALKICSVRLENAKATIAARDAQIEVFARVDKEKDQAIGSLRVLATEQNLSIQQLKASGEALETRLRAKERQLATERGEWADTEARLNAILPVQCDAKVREILDRLIYSVNHTGAP